MYLVPCLFFFPPIMVLGPTQNRAASPYLMPALDLTGPHTALPEAGIYLESYFWKTNSRGSAFVEGWQRSGEAFAVTSFCAHISNESPRLALIGTGWGLKKSLLIPLL